MYTSRKKIHKDNDAEPTEFEETVAQVNLIAFSQEAYFTISDCSIFWILAIWCLCAVPVWFGEH